MARAKTNGNGWKGQTLRHSNAKRYGHAGGTYLSAPLQNKATQLPIQFRIVVPSTTNKNEKLTPLQYQSRIDETAKDLSKKFGGETTIRGVGGYVSQEGELINEDVAVIESSMKLEDYKKNKLALGNFIKNKQKSWGQETIGYGVEDELYIYPKFD